MSAEQSYISEAQQRILRLELCLAGHEVDGLSPGQIAQLNECTASQVTRDLANLKHAGRAEQLPTGRWRLGPQIVQIAMRHMTALERARTRLDETTQRYSRR